MAKRRLSEVALLYLLSEVDMQKPRKKLLGLRFGKLVVSKISIVKKQGKPAWDCVCDCGNTMLATSHELTYGKITSCKCNQHKRLPKGEASFNQLYNNYKQNAKKRGLEFDFPVIKFRKVVTSNCFYCEKKPDKQYGTDAFNGRFEYIGIDRVDNSKGYTLNNSVPCCESCNHRKGGISIDMINKIYGFISQMQT